jgi:hypothetical protein
VIRVYPERFPRRESRGEVTDDEVHLTPDARIVINTEITQRHKKGAIKTDTKLVCIRAVDEGMETLASIEMHPKDAERLMETLVFSFAGREGLETPKRCMGRDASEPRDILQIGDIDQKGIPSGGKCST